MEQDEKLIQIEDLLRYLSGLSPEQFQAWAAAEPPNRPLKDFNLSNHDGRVGFLYEFYMIGGAALFEAVQHVWASLNEPRTARGTWIGLAAGTGGTGKTAVLRCLKKFLSDALTVDHPLPSRSAYDTLQSWHAASMRSFEAVETDVLGIAAVFSSILDGSERETTKLPVVVAGPWKQVIDNPGPFTPELSS